MDAVETPDQRKARQFAHLRQLGEFGMDLATRAHAQASRQLAAGAADARDGYDAVAAFNALSRAVRQGIAIEHRLDAPARARPQFPFRPANGIPDPRRILLRRTFDDAVRGDPDRAMRRRENRQVIEEHLAANPEQPIGDAVDDLCQILGIELQLSRVPDELIDMPPRPPRPPEGAAADPDPADPPDD